MPPSVTGHTLEAALFAVEEFDETAKLTLLLRGSNPRGLDRAQVAEVVRLFDLPAWESGEMD